VVNTCSRNSGKEEEKKEKESGGGKIASDDRRGKSRGSRGNQEKSGHRYLELRDAAEGTHLTMHRPQRKEYGSIVPWNRGREGKWARIINMTDSAV